MCSYSGHGLVEWDESIEGVSPKKLVHAFTADRSAYSLLEMQSIYRRGWQGRDLAQAACGVHFYVSLSCLLFPLFLCFHIKMGCDT